jgi:hypothetical protein
MSQEGSKPSAAATTQQPPCAKNERGTADKKLKHLFKKKIHFLLQNLFFLLAKFSHEKITIADACAKF